MIITTNNDLSHAQLFVLSQQGKTTMECNSTVEAIIDLIETLSPEEMDVLVAHLPRHFMARIDPAEVVGSRKMQEVFDSVQGHFPR